MALPWAMLIFVDTGSVWFWLSMAVLQEIIAESIALAIFLRDSDICFLEFENFDSRNVAFPLPESTLRGSWQTHSLLLVNLLILIWYDVAIYCKPWILKQIGSFYGRRLRIQIADPQWWVWRGFGSTWLWCP